MTAPVIYVRYLDHVHFERVDPGDYAKPLVLEAVGWLDAENSDCIRLVFERLAGPAPKETKFRPGGLLIMKSAILERRELNNKMCIDTHDDYGKKTRGNRHDPRAKEDAEPAPRIRGQGGHI